MRGFARFMADAGGWGITSVLAASISLGVTIWEHVKGEAFPSFWFLCATVALFWIGAYKAWSKKHQQLQEEKEKNKLPDLDGRINQVLIGRASYTDEARLGALGLQDSLIVLNVEVWNKTNIERTSVKDHRLALEVDGITYSGTKKYEIPGLRWIDIQEHPNDSKLRMDVLTGTLGDLWYASLRQAYVPFYVAGLPYGEHQKANVQLTLIDVFDKPHFIRSNDCDVIPGKISCERPA